MIRDILDRHHWRALPLMHVVVPTLDAPMLAFDDEHEAAAALLQARIDDLAARHRKAFDSKAKRLLAMRIRKTHLMRVSLAVGVRVPPRRITWGFIDG